MNTVTIQQEITLLRSFAISVIGKDKEGAYRPEFVRRVRAKINEKATERLGGAHAFLKELEQAEE